MRTKTFHFHVKHSSLAGASLKMQTSVAAIGILLTVVSFAQTSLARQQNGSTERISDLSSRNFSRVSASPAEIKSVLLKDGGLLVELKRAVAKYASDHGQIVSDADLTNDAIFDRLETDVQFRSVATNLLQEYGYLLPKLNPDSDAAKEKTLLMQERTKWVAQRQEEDLAQARLRGNRNPQDAGTCDPRFEKDCAASQTRPAPVGSSRQQNHPGDPTFQNIPGDSTPLNDSDRGRNQLMRAQSMQTGNDLTTGSSEFQSTDSYGSSTGFNNVSANPRDTIGAQNGTPSSGIQRGRALPGPDYGADRSSDGLLAAYGGGIRSSTSSRMPEDSNGATGQGATGTLPQGTLTVVPMQPYDRRFPSATIAQPAEMIRKRSPYEDIPSLYDMYVQAVPRPAAPRRFGADVFENGTRDSQLIPMDLPVGPDYVVGPGDGLSVDLWGGVSQRLYRTVDREGRVSLPEVGPILVSGKSLAAVQQNLQQVLRTQFRDVSADVSLARLRTIRIYEVGDLANPGAYDISSLSTPLNALFAGGGPTQRGSMRILKHYRGTQLVQTVDLYDLLLHGVKSDLQRLENGDTVQVPPIGPQVTVEGMVRRPAIYELRNEKTLASVLELAGGLLPTAALRHIEVQRIVAHEKQTMLSVDIPEADSAPEAAKKLESFEINEGDRIRIFPIVPYNQDAIYLEGHVVRPGRYSFRSDMKIGDIISSYKDLLPEPAMHYGEIIRLNAPDFHPTVEHFDVSETLADPSASPALHALDTIRIFSRFDFENPPTVSVLGDVRAPGTYKTSGQIHLADAVHLAGGLTPDAQTTDAQVFRYLPDGKFKVFSVSLSRALAGDPTENIAMQPRDRLLIHRNPDAAEQASVYIQGEVVTPGRYPLTTTMRVADLIRVGGGLKPSADTQSADLTQYQWSDTTKLTGAHTAVALSASLAGDSNFNLALRNGDVLTVRQLPGWNDLGASIVVKGEVKHPGPYGIHPGERLSSVLERAGGFGSGAYPYGAVLQRTQVRELESNSRNEMILRVKDAQGNLQLLPETDPKQKQAKEVALQQWQQTIEQLSANPPLGRVTIRISPRIDRWKNSAADIEVRAGDVLVIPKRPSYIMVTGQVFNPTAVTFRPGKSANWYLGQSGGPTQMGNKKAIFVIHADGSVVGTRNSLWSGESLSTTLQPGDTVVVPEKALGGGVQWQSVLLTAQVASSIASTAFIFMRY